RLGFAAPPPVLVAQQIERDRVEPGLLARLAAVEAPASAERTLERVGQKVLGQHTVAGAVAEEGVQRLSVLRIQPLKCLVPQGSHTSLSVCNAPARALLAKSGRLFGRLSASAWAHGATDR